LHPTNPTIKCTEHIPQNKLTPTRENKGMNPKTMWWYWVPVAWRSWCSNPSVLASSELSQGVIDALGCAIKEHRELFPENKQNLALEFGKGGAGLASCAGAASDVWKHVELLFTKSDEEA
jgi:hypothetical protein